MRFILLPALLYSLNGLSQNHFYKPPAIVPSSYAVNTDSMYKSLIAENSDLKGDLQREYAESVTFYLSELINSGKVYFNCVEIEGYLNTLLSKILQVTNSTQKFRIYLVRNAEVNASALDNGIIYINIGLLAKIKDEAALVSVIAHEVSHALNSDSKKLISLHDKHTGKGKSAKDLLRMSHGSREFEARADSSGFSAAIKMGYNIYSSYSTFIGFESEYQWNKSQYSYKDPKWYISLDREGTNINADSLGKFLLDHPDNYQRIALLNKIAGNGNGNNYFLENESLFRKIKKMAQLEQLYLDLEKGDYKDCLRNAFYYHLFDQKDADFLYYISESIRSLILIDPSLKNKGFLTENSKNKIFENNKGILHDVSFVSLDTSFKKILVNDTIYGQFKKPFETYLQAATFFIKKSMEAKAPGINLTAALFELNRNKTEKGTAFLDAYLAEPSASYREFATAVSKGTLTEELAGNAKNLVYLKPTEYYYTEKGKIKYSYEESQKMNVEITNIVRKYFDKENSFNELIMPDSLDITTYQLFEEMTSKLKVFKNSDEAENENLQYKFQDPDYWKAKEIQNPLDVEVLVRKKNFFHLEPRAWNWFRDTKIRNIMILKPYMYKHPVLGLYIYLDIAWFDPIAKNYIYEKPSFEKYKVVSIKKILKRFEKRKTERC